MTTLIKWPTFNLIMDTQLNQLVIKCVMKIHIPSQTLALEPLKLENGLVFSSYTLLGM